MLAGTNSQDFSDGCPRSLYSSRNDKLPVLAHQFNSPRTGAFSILVTLQRSTFDSFSMKRKHLHLYEHIVWFKYAVAHWQRSFTAQYVREERVCLLFRMPKRRLSRLRISPPTTSRTRETTTATSRSSPKSVCHFPVSFSHFTVNGCQSNSSWLLCARASQPHISFGMAIFSQNTALVFWCSAIAHEKIWLQARLASFQVIARKHARYCDVERICARELDRATCKHDCFLQHVHVTGLLSSLRDHPSYES